MKREMKNTEQSQVLQKWFSDRADHCQYNNLNDLTQIKGFLHDCDQDIAFLLATCCKMSLRIDELEKSK